MVVCPPTPPPPARCYHHPPPPLSENLPSGHRRELGVSCWSGLQTLSGERAACSRDLKRELGQGQARDRGLSGG